MDVDEPAPLEVVLDEGVDARSLTVEDIERIASAKLGTKVVIEEGTGFALVDRGDWVERCRLVVMGATESWRRKREG